MHARRTQCRADQVGRAQGAGEQARGQQAGDAAVDGYGELRRLGGRGEGVDQVDGADRVGVDQVEGLAVEAGLVGDVVHRLGDVVDRDHVGVAEVDADQRHPVGQVVAQPLEQREEVVRPVDLVHLAGLGVADDDRGTVDAPRHGRLVAHDLLGLELGAVVRRGQPLALVEHGLVEDAAVVTRRRHRGDLVEVSGLELGRQGERVAGAPDVHRLVHLVGGGHVVDRREVEEVLDLAGVRGDPLVAHAEVGLTEVAEHRRDAVAAPLLDQRLEPADRALAAQREDLALPVVDQLLDEEASDEAGGAGDEVGHGEKHRSRRSEVSGKSFNSPRDAGSRGRRHITGR